MRSHSFANPSLDRPVHRLWHSLGIAVACALGAFACSSTDLSVTAPSGNKCQVSVTNSAGTIPATGGTGVLAVTTTRDCTWDVTTSTPWIVLTADGIGQGDGEVTYRVTPNVDPASRRTSVLVNDTPVVIAQEAATCRFTPTPSVTRMAASGGTVTVSVDTASSACAWTATSEADWIRVSTNGQSGPGSVTLTVDANSGSARTGLVSVGGQTVRIEQEAVPASPPAPAPEPAPTPGPGPAPNPTPGPGPAPTPDPTPPPGPTPTCAIALLPTQATVPASGDSGTMVVAATLGCNWTGVSNAAWLTMPGGSNGSGPGTLRWAAAPSTVTTIRTATITVAGQVFTVTQEAAKPAACTYAISPTSADVDTPQTTLAVSLTTQAGCEWRATSNDDWLEVASAPSGTGSTTVSIDVARKSGNGRRTGTVSIAGETFTVRQSRGNGLEEP